MWHSHITAFQTEEKAPKARLEQTDFSNFTGRLNTEMLPREMLECLLDAIRHLGQSLYASYTCYFLSLLAWGNTYINASHVTPSPTLLRNTPYLVFTRATSGNWNTKGVVFLKEKYRQKRKKKRKKRPKQAGTHSQKKHFSFLANLKQNHSHATTWKNAVWWVSPACGRPLGTVSCSPSEREEGASLLNFQTNTHCILQGPEDQETVEFHIATLCMENLF